MAGTTTHYSLPTVESTDAINGASQITALAKATDNALYEIAQSAGETYTLPVATSDTLGGVKPGTGLTVTDDGTLSVDISAILTAATTWGDIADHGFTYQNS